jgi:hypothetical protein
MSATAPLAALARGVVAGAVGTVAMTVSERLEMALTGREASTVPGQVGAHLLPGKDPDSQTDVAQLNSATHWVHGISLGAVRGLLDVAGLHGPAASAAHFALLWGGDAALYRALGIADVPWRWEAAELASDMLHKGVYAAVTGAVYDALADHSSTTPELTHAPTTG